MNVDKQLASARDRLRNAPSMSARVPIQKEINRLLELKEAKKNSKGK